MTWEAGKSYLTKLGHKVLIYAVYPITSNRYPIHGGILDSSGQYRAFDWTKNGKVDLIYDDGYDLTPKLWVEPKKKVKLAQYAFKNEAVGEWQVTKYFYKDDKYFLENYDENTPFIRLEHTEIEVDE